MTLVFWYNSSMSSYRTLWPYVRRYWLMILGGISALLFVDLLQLIIPRVTKSAVDQLSNFSASPESLARAGLTIVLLAATIGVFRYVWRRLILGFARTVEKDLRRRLYGKLLTMSPAWFLARPTGQVMAHATNDLDAVRMASGMGLVTIVDSLLMGTASIGFMAWISPTLTLLILIPMPLVPILTRFLGTVMHRRYLQVQETFGRLTGLVREYLTGIRVVQAQVREDLVLADVDRLGQTYVRQNIRLNFVSGGFYPLMSMFTNLSLAIVLYFGGRLTIWADISPGDFVAFLSYLGLLTWPMMALGWMTDLIQRGAAGLDRINSVLEREPDITDPADAVTLPTVLGAVIINNLSFTYSGRDQAALSDINLTCPPGRITAIVGRTGAGKSTLLNLLPRLFDPPPETVLLDGVDVRRLRLADLRAVMGYVPQDGYIFSGTLAENIAFGWEAADENSIRTAAEAAQLADEIESFPQGYHTVVGERGLTLSGGQRQRLALARALLLNPPILILDDTFSALDADAEERILARIARHRAGRTTIIVSHRLTSLKIADLIHVIDQGRVIESGTHQELLALDGYYAHLNYLQEMQSEYGRQSTTAEPGAAHVV